MGSEIPAELISVVAIAERKAALWPKEEIKS
jgi:hypothetical protein